MKASVIDWPQRARDRGGKSPLAYAEMDDGALLQRLRGGDASALEALYDRYASLVFSLVLRVLSRRDRAEEVVQEVFLKLWREPDRFEPERGAFRFWLLRVAHNRAIDDIRRNRHEVVLAGGDAEEDPWSSFSDPGPRPEDSALAQIDREAVLAALESLAPAQREALQLAYFEGLTHTEIAGRLGEPLGTVKTRVRLGIRRLRELLRDPMERMDGR